MDNGDKHREREEEAKRFYTEQVEEQQKQVLAREAELAAKERAMAAKERALAVKERSLAASQRAFNAREMIDYLYMFDLYILYICVSESYFFYVSLRAYFRVEALSDAVVL